MQSISPVVRQQTGEASPSTTNRKARKHHTTTPPEQGGKTSECGLRRGHKCARKRRSAGTETEQATPALTTGRFSASRKNQQRACGRRRSGMVRGGVSRREGVRGRPPGHRAYARPRLDVSKEDGRQQD
jgi:hypothetical protein